MKNLVSTILLLCLAGGLSAQAIQDSPRTAPPTGSQQSLSQSAVPQGELPLRRISLFSSGVGYFEHAGTLAGSAEVKFPFKAASVNDALKSLVLNDPGAGSPSVSYPSEQTLLQTLRSLKIDLSNDPDTAAILDSLRGAEIEIAAPNPITGRITGVEYRIAPGETGAQEPWVSLFTSQGLRAVSLREINSLAFKDPQINADLTRALDLIMASRNSGSRDLSVSLPGSGSRRVTISYVIPSPVWKVSYRLDLGNAGSGIASAGNPVSARFQGWAIVDNDGDTDWNEVELSLVAGRPVSFIQNLYPPYYLSRPTLPLAIAGTAQAQTWDSAYAAEEYAPADLESNLLMRDMSTKSARQSDMMEAAVPRPAPPPSAGLGSVAAAAATGQAAGDQFEFTIQKPVTLNRRMSAMLPLVDGSMDVKKLLIFSGAGAPGRNVHPNLGAEISNTTGMKLPAGPITVYDGGTYAGDALVEFLNDGEKRLISWGEDLSVTGTTAASSARTLSAVSISGGHMTISRKQGYEKKYTLNNVSAEKKTLIVEHPITSGATLTEPVAFTGQTPTVYRFTRELPAKGELELLVREEIPLYERISLLPLRLDALVSYAANQEIPPSVRASLQQAAELKRKADDASKARTETEGRRAFLVSEQDRIRRNLEAAGNNTQQGQEYLKRMASLDADIDAQSSRIDDATKAAEAAQKAYEDYLNGLEL
ncbi:hypothetical protein AGMMS50268_10980 [Spirochaetia bacterium]|nr:hypothetical protein AGMMS50268_10980 [Spirochaetia bacterium]